MDSRTFEYLMPTPEQKAKMEACRQAAKIYAEVLDKLLPPGTDKDHTLRTLRDAAMWANIAITRGPDGAPLVE